MISYTTLRPTQPIRTHAQRLQHLDGSSEEWTILGSAVLSPSSVGEVVMAI